MARLTVTDDLPTPPLPEATRITWVRSFGSANGIARSAMPPRNCRFISARCSSLIAPRVSSMPQTPGTEVTAAVTSCSMVLFIGQPGMVSSTVSETTSSASTVSDSTMPSSVIGRLISGSITPSSAFRTAASSSLSGMQEPYSGARDPRSGIALGRIGTPATVIPAAGISTSGTARRGRSRVKPGMTRGRRAPGTTER